MNATPPFRAGGASLDQEVLMRLRNDLGDDVVQRFIQRYVCLLPGRLDGVEDALGLRDLRKAVPILCDLRNSSAMLGALALAHLANLLEQFLRLGQIDQAADALPTLRSQAAEVIKALLHVNWQGGGHSPSR